MDRLTKSLAAAGLALVASAAHDRLGEELRREVAEELNVHGVEALSSAGEGLVDHSAKGNFRALGKRFAKQTPHVAAAIAAADAGALAAALNALGRVAVAPLVIQTLFDRVFVQGDLGALPGVLGVGGAVVLAGSAALWAQDALFATLGVRTAAAWRAGIDWHDLHSGLCSMAFCRFSTTLSWRIISSILACASGLNSSSFRASISRIRALRACSCSSALFWNIWAKRWGSSTAAAIAGFSICSCVRSAGSPKTCSRMSSGSWAAAPPPGPAAGLPGGGAGAWF